MDVNLKEKSMLITEILQRVKANDCCTSGDMFFSLAFRSLPDLKNIAKELYIKTK